MNGVGVPEVSEFGSVDPAPPQVYRSLDEHRDEMLNEEQRMFLRMRAIFALRNIGGVESVAALCDGFASSSALLRHEIAYVLGQMQNSSALPRLVERLQDNSEHVMVRHEAAEAMGAIGEQSIRPILEIYRFNQIIEVAESCEVALDLLDLCLESNCISDC